MSHRSNLPSATILGYPRIGRKRELKRAVEAYWKGELDQPALQAAAAELRAATRARLVALGLHAKGGAVPESFSFYDQVLDATLALGIGIAARLKGFDRTLAAVAAQPKLHLLLAGSSDRWLAPQVAELGLQDRVRLLPYVPNVMDLLNAADLFVHPAREEAGGIVIGEALLAGLPVIVSAVCGYAPVVARSGAGIVLPEPFTPEALSAALTEVTGALPAFRERASAQAANLRETRGAWLRCIAEQVEAAAATR